MRRASLGVPVHLVPLSFQPHAPLSRLVLLSCLHSFVLCVHTCTLALTLAFRLPSGRRVCVTLVVTGIQLDCFVPFSAGGQSHVAVDCPTKRAAMWLISGRDAFWTYLLGCGVDKLSLQSSGKGLMSSADVHVRRQPVASTPTCEFGPFSV